jgi:integrase
LGQPPGAQFDGRSTQPAVPGPKQSTTRKARLDGKLTPLAVRRLSTPGLHADGGGLYLRVSPTGARSWILIVHLGGRRREMGLGSVRTYTLADARERARECRKLVDKGIDPITHRSAEVAANEAAQAARKTFKECATDYMRLHQPQWRNAKHTKDWPSSLERYVYPEFGDKDIGTVTKADILRVLEPIWHDKTETATRVKSRMRLVLHWAAAKGHCAPDPRLWTDVTAALPRASRIKRTTHYAAAPYASVPEILKVVRASSATDTVKALFQFVVLTAARSGEARGARWSEVDLAAKTWTIPGERMKAGKSHRVPLSDAALVILQAQPRVEGNDLVFPTPKGVQYSDMTLTALLRRLKFPITMHGFRSSFRDWAGETTSTPHDVVEAALAHIRGDATVQAYARSDLFDKRRTLTDAWATYCVGT